MRESPAPTVAVRLAESEAERRRVYRFRYRVLVEELGVEAAGADDAAREVRDGLDHDALHLMLLKADTLVAAIRLAGGGEAPLPAAIDALLGTERFAAFGRKALTLTDRLVVARDHPESELAVLLGAAYKTGRKLGGRFDFTHCSPAMVQLYEQLGYRRYTECFVDSETGYRVPMVLLTEDLGYLRDVRSPFAALAGGFANLADSAIWFSRSFPQYGALKSEPLRDEMRFWGHLCERLRQAPTVGIPLFAGMEFAEARRFLKIGTILRVRQGAVIVRAGTPGDEMYVVLSGALEARVGGQPVATFGRGDAFGEIGFLSAEPRSADVVATDDVEVLVLTQEYLKRAMEALPAIAAKVLFNLSLMLCQRLKDTTRNWLAARTAA